MVVSADYWQYQHDDCDGIEEHGITEISTVRGPPPVRERTCTRTGGGQELPCALGAFDIQEFPTQGKVPVSGLPAKLSCFDLGGFRWQSVNRSR